MMSEYKDLNVLFIAGAKRVSLADYFYQSAEARKLKLNLFSYELSEKVPIAEVSKIIIGLKWNDPLIVQHIVEKIKQFDIHIVLAFKDEATLFLSDIKSICPDVFIPCSNTDICRKMFDKKLSAIWFSKYNFPIPKNYKESDNILFPVLLKLRQGFGSKGIYVIDNEGELRLFEQKNNLNDFLIEEYINPSIEYTVDCYVDSNSNIISIVPRIRLEVIGGEVMNTITKFDNNIISISEEIINRGAFKGPITIQFIRNKNTQKLYVMEVNPRFGGGVIASIASGANIVSSLIDEYLGNQLSRITDWRENTLMTRYFKEVIFYADNN